MIKCFSGCSIFNENIDCKKMHFEYNFVDSRFESDALSLCTKGAKRTKDIFVRVY